MNTLFFAHRGFSFPLKLLRPNWLVSCEPLAVFNLFCGETWEVIVSRQLPVRIRMQLGYFSCCLQDRRSRCVVTTSCHLWAVWGNWGLCTYMAKTDQDGTCKSKDLLDVCEKYKSDNSRFLLLWLQLQDFIAVLLWRSYTFPAKTLNLSLIFNSFWRRSKSFWFSMCLKTTGSGVACSVLDNQNAWAVWKLAAT